MSDEIDSAFVEIAAGAPELDAAGDELVALYGDAAPVESPESAGNSRLRNACWAVFVAMVMLLAIAGVYLLLIFAVWTGNHGMLPAPN